MRLWDLFSNTWASSSTHRTIYAPGEFCFSYARISILHLASRAILPVNMGATFSANDVHFFFFFFFFNPIKARATIPCQPVMRKRADFSLMWIVIDFNFYLSKYNVNSPPPANEKCLVKIRYLFDIWIRGTLMYDLSKGQMARQL